LRKASVGRYAFLWWLKFLLWSGWLKLVNTNPKGAGALFRWVGMPFLCWLVFPFVEGVAKAFYKNSHGGGSLASVGRYALLCWLVSSFVEVVTNIFENKSQREYQTNKKACRPTEARTPPR
jgi:hypothetical protein